jgi:hypothetical protein
MGCKMGARERNQRRFFQRELDAWTTEVVVAPIVNAYEALREAAAGDSQVQEQWTRTVAQTQQVVRQKMLGILGYRLARKVNRKCA